MTPALSSKEYRWGPGLAHLSVVYVVWGSTYLAIRIAVREGSGIEPFMLGATRTLAAGVLLLLWNRLRRARIRPTPQEWFTLVVSGLLLWIGGNGLVNWGVQYADSGYAALLVGTMPIWVVLVESVVDRRKPPFRLVCAVLVGFAGLGLLSYPELRDGGRADVLAFIALLLAPLSWGVGSVLQTRRPVKLTPTASAAIQQLVGATGFFLLAGFLGEAWPTPNAEAAYAWIYLVVAGSIFAFTSFIMTLRLLPTTVVMTYSYVNPVIAVFLGWYLLDEQVTIYILGGTLLILLGVVGVFYEKKAGRPRNGSD